MESQPTPLARVAYYGGSDYFLDIQVTGGFPETAAQYIEKNHLGSPLYNDFNWGAY